MSLERDITIEKLIKDFKEYEQEKERMINVCLGVINDYNRKIDQYTYDILSKRNGLENQIKSMMDIKEMKENKTEYAYNLPSCKVSFKKERHLMKLKEEFNIDNVPSKFIKEVRKVDWNNYKKVLQVKGEDIINIQTGEIVEDVVLEKTGGGELVLKIFEDKEIEENEK
ncbi:MAG: hypothetical protein PVJ67_04955 [Candidatus Pacearchaeota archaeon]